MVKAKGAVGLLVAAFLVLTACGSDDASSSGQQQIACSDKGLVKGASVASLCGCNPSYVSCPAAGANVGKEACLCVQEGGTCSSSVEGFFFCGSSRAAVRCKAGKIVSGFSCPGTGECSDVASHQGVFCGSQAAMTAFAIEGDPCAGEQLGACSPDQAKVLQCQRGTWTSSVSCDGGKACARLQAGDMGLTCPGGQTTCYQCK